VGCGMAAKKRPPRAAKATQTKKKVKAPAKKAAPARKVERRQMADAAESSGEFGWSPSRFELQYRRWSANDAATSVLLSHPTAPFPSGGYLVPAINNDTVQELGRGYIGAVSENEYIDPPLDLPLNWIKELGGSGSNSRFGWLPLGWPPKDSNDSKAGDPFVSFQAQRFAADGTLLPDQTVILFASEWINIDGTRVVAGSEFGIRLVAHALRQNGGFQIWITGMTASLPSGYYRTQGLSTGPDATFATLQLASSTFADIKTAMASQVDLKSDDISLRGVRVAMVDETLQIEWRAASKPATGANYTRTTPYSFVFRGTEGKPVSLVSKVELVADAIGDAWVFPLDPASQNKPTPIHERRPTRGEPWLDESPPYSHSYLRYPETIGAGPLAFPSSLPPPLPHLPPEMKVVVCPGFVVADDPPAVTSGSTKVVNLPGTPLTPLALSNDFAAVSAFNNVREFFYRLTDYGLSAYLYFRVAQMPLKLYYRSGIRPGPGKDGQTVNARVLVEGWSPDWVGPLLPANQRPVLRMQLALADLSTRRRKPWNGADRSQAEPLGIAADARWIWHEIGHVLLMASVGELEFRFAHSAGDALAAIVADPQSALAARPNWPKWRGATFPWVFTPRRHDRCVSCGWGWSGALHYDMSQVPDTTHPRRKGYWTEQILSSTLFRLYRCLGGDTISPPGGPDESTRESASHYCVYLIMGGIQTLGTSGIVLANEPEQFVAALQDADISTGAWNVGWNLQWDVLTEHAAPTTFPFNRVGGCVWKVIRWAFEAQGMYNEPNTINNAPGLPPPVDVYIENLRPTNEPTPYGPIEYGPGSYVPVSLDWDPDQVGSDPAPLWQADPTNGVQVVGGNITVKVGNRGSQAATNVQVSVWWSAWPVGNLPPKWGDPMAPWTACNPQPSSGQTIGPGSQATFGPFAFAAAPPAGTRYLVLAQATCPDDKANTTLLLSSQMPAPLLDLVANDNNLGLIVMGP
jgi:hypothetical protein